MSLFKRLSLVLCIALLRQRGVRALRRGNYGRARKITEQIRRLERLRRR